jgi:hypothetical protein
MMERASMSHIGWPQGPSVWVSCGTGLNPGSKLAVVPLLLLSITLLPQFAPPAHAQACVPATQTYPSPDGLNRYRINTGQFAAELGMTSAQARFAVGLAASAWNLNGRSGYFEYSDSTTREGPDDFCSDPGDWNLITISEDDFGVCGNGAAFSFVAPACNGTRWWMNICPNSTLVFWKWMWSGSPTVGHVDLVQSIAHDFGHVIGLGHPTDTMCNVGGAVMCRTAYSIGGTRQRDLYPWDVRCSFDYADARQLDVVAAEYWFGTLSGTYPVAPDEAFKGHPNRQSSGTGPSWSRTVHRGNDPVRTWVSTYPSLLATSPSRHVNSARRSHTPSATWWPERPEYLRSMLHVELGSASWDQSYGIMQALSTVDLSAGTLSWLSHCTTAGWPCSNSIVQSGHRIAHAWDDYNSTSVTSWVHQNRWDHTGDREIRISHGSFSDQHVGLPHKTGRYAPLPPAIACRAYQAGDYYDCILAYVSLGDLDGRIRLRMFYYYQGNYYWRPTEVSLSLYTATGMTLWYQSGYWWLAYGVLGTANAVHVYRSSNGNVWSYQHSLGRSIQAPAAASHWAEELNYVYLAR